MATEGKNLSEYNKEQMPDASGWSFGLVVSEWNESITGSLYKGAFQALVENGVPEQNISRINVPGSFELVNASRKLCQSNNFDAIIAIGSVIQGETKHFDFVCQGVSNGLAYLNANYETSIIFCVLTDNTMQQSIDRSGGKHGNKGTESGVAAIKMAALKNLSL